MKVMVLYTLTALVTGLHNSYEIMSIVNGAPINLLNCAALLGSVALLGAAVLTRIRLHIAPRVALGGSLLSWIFYAPLIVVSFLMPFSTRFEIRSLILSREYVPLVGAFVGPILLAASTTISILFFRRRLAPAEVLR